MQSAHALLTIAILTQALVAHASLPTKNPPPIMPVSVSAANYAETPAAELFRAVNDQIKINPTAPDSAPQPRNQTYIFAPGDLYSRDISYEEICAKLTATLEQRGFHNAADAKGRIADPNKIDLVLRLTVGTRYWRDPSVRLDHLTWGQGLEPKVWTQISLNGGQATFDRRRGGDDAALSKVGGIQDAQEGSGVPGAGGTSANANGPMSQQGLMSPTAEYESTREFFILVVDAFNYAELQEKGDRTKRVWTTFIAMPRQDKELLSDVLPTLAKVGGPYLGETTRGLQMFNDARARVTPGEIKVIESDVKLPAGDRK